MGKPLITSDEREALEKKYPYLKGFPEFLQTLDAESDRGMVLTSCAMLDDALERAIERKLLAHKAVKQLTDGFNAPLGTFSSRILAAFALGIVSEREYLEMEIHRRVRNRFAHDVRASFEDQQVIDWCRNLVFSIPVPNAEPAARYATSIVPVIIAMLNRADGGASDRLIFIPPKNEKW
ncbi:MAG TPA: MltR family transcriptional regulator [Acidobacteriaceae bacterium]|jgi:DNA-binding MltR family transcriptional regulator|nr:MltR family transcriptional regulator [Acidobacteriaceae bacterium]